MHVWAYRPTERCGHLLHELLMYMNLAQCPYSLFIYLGYNGPWIKWMFLVVPEKPIVTKFYCIRNLSLIKSSFVEFFPFGIYRVRL